MFFEKGYGDFIKEMFSAVPGAGGMFTALTTSRDKIDEIRAPFRDIVQKQNAKYNNTITEELIKEDLYDKVSQAFAVLLPVKSVGVVGDERRYAEVIALRAVETVDFMTATWAKLPYDFLGHVSNRIVNEIEEISRVVYDISSKPPATIEWE